MTKSLDTKGMHPAIFSALQQQAPDLLSEKSKFNNERIHDPDHGWFDSKHELRDFHVLLLRARCGEIRELKRQVRFMFGIPGEDRYVLTEGGRKQRNKKPLVYVADFTYEERVGADDWRYVVHDSKGAKTKEYIIKKALMFYFYGIEIKET